jgi:hypothetical protein
LASSLPACASDFFVLRFPVFLQPPISSARPEERSLLRFCPPSGLLPEGLARALSSQAPLLESLCRLTYEFRRSPHRPEDFHLLGYGPRSGFRNLFAAYSSIGLASLFHPANAFRLHPSGVSPPKEPSALFTRPLPSCLFSVAALPPPRMVGPPAHRSRILGVRSVPFFGFTALLPLRVRYKRP